MTDEVDDLIGESSYAITPEGQDSFRRRAIEQAYRAEYGDTETRLEHLFYEINVLKAAQDQGIQLKAGDRLRQWGMQLEAKGLSKHTMLKLLNILGVVALAGFTGFEGYTAIHNLRIINDTLANFLHAPEHIRLALDASTLAAKGAVTTGVFALLRPFNLVPYIERAVGKSSQFISRFMPKTKIKS